MIEIILVTWLAVGSWMVLAFVERMVIRRGPWRDGGRTTRETEAVKRVRTREERRRRAFNQGWTEVRDV